MVKQNPDFSFKNTLSGLMASRGLKERDVVKATGLPQTTISNILNGRSKHPRPLTIKLLSTLFGLTMEQFTGYDNLVSSSSSKASISVAPIVIPLLKWNEVNLWLSEKCPSQFCTTWLANDICKSRKAFALNIKASMQSQFYFSTGLLLVDPQSIVSDNSMIIVFLEKSSQEPTLRRLKVDGDQKWLKSLESSIPSIPCTSENHIIGTVVQVRYDPNIH